MYTLMLSFLPPPRLLLARTPAATCAPWRLHLVFHTCKTYMQTSNHEQSLSAASVWPSAFDVFTRKQKNVDHILKTIFRNFWANLIEIDHFRVQGGQMVHGKENESNSLSAVKLKAASCQKMKTEHVSTRSLSLSLSLLWFLLLCNGIAWLPDRLPSRLSYSHRWLSLSCQLPDLHFWAPSGGPSGSSVWQLILSPAFPTLQHPQGKQQPKEIEKSSYSSLPLEGGLIVKKWDL